MKTQLFNLFVALSVQVFAQNPIPNSGFESWTGGNPTGWNSTNILTITPVSQSSVAHAGNSAAKLEVVNSFSTSFPPILMCNSITVNQNYQTVSYYYKANLIGTDIAYFTALLDENNNNMAAGADSLKLANNTNIYTQRSFNLFYTPPVNTIADELNLMVFISAANGTPNIGSNILIDDVLISGGLPTSLNETEESNVFSFDAPHPNPNHGFCLLPFTLVESGRIEISVFSIDGKLQKTLLETELNPGKYKAECDLTDWPKGLYFAKIKTNNQQAVQKIAIE